MINGKLLQILVDLRNRESCSEIHSTLTYHMDQVEVTTLAQMMRFRYRYCDD